MGFLSPSARAEVWVPPVVNTTTATTQKTALRCFLMVWFSLASSGRWNVVLHKPAAQAREYAETLAGAAGLLDDAHFQPAVGEPGIAAAVLALQDFVEAVDKIFLRQLAVLLEIAKPEVAFGIDVHAADMRDLAGL